MSRVWGGGGGGGTAKCSNGCVLAAVLVQFAPLVAITQLPLSVM